MVESVLIGGTGILMVVGILLIYYFRELRRYERQRDVERRDARSA